MLLILFEKFSLKTGLSSHKQVKNMLRGQSICPFFNSRLWHVCACSMEYKHYHQISLKVENLTQTTFRFSSISFCSLNTNRYQERIKSTSPFSILLVIHLKSSKITMPTAKSIYQFFSQVS